tara:strand:+ start:885 stop:1367 length:483 start_codon:yes stop_codon:yes gene_type:complete
MKNSKKANKETIKELKELTISNEDLLTLDLNNLDALLLGSDLKDIQTNKGSKSTKYKFTSDKVTKEQIEIFEKVCKSSFKYKNEKPNNKSNRSIYRKKFIAYFLNNVETLTKKDYSLFLFVYKSLHSINDLSFDSIFGSLDDDKKVNAIKFHTTLKGMKV